MQDLQYRPVSESVILRIKHCLMRAEALNFTALREIAGLAQDTVVSALYRLVLQKEVEVLRPITMHDPQPITLHPFEHYRLIKPSDKQFRWQTELQQNTMTDTHKGKIYEPVFL